MRRTTLLAFLILSVAFIQAAAQTPPSHKILSDPNMFADAHLKGLDAQVHLSDEQKEKLRPVFYAEGQSLIAIMNDSSLAEDQRGQMIQRLHEETAAKVATLLTPAQRKNHGAPSRQTPSTQQSPNRI
jgi:Spy/CpxP family protein refolding chaperone